MFTLMDYWKSVPGSELLIESGKRIVKRRKALKISQSALLDYIRQNTGIKSRTVISEWEHGKRKIETLGQLAALADLLQCDPEYITCQCDTLRKEYSDPVSRFGLSEESFKTLEKETEEKQFTLEHGHEVDKALGIVGKPYNHFYDTDIIDFVLGHRDILSAFRYILDLKAAEAEGKRHYRVVDLDSKNHLPSPLREYYWRENAKQNQDLFIAEQQLIAEIRKALEK